MYNLKVVIIGAGIGGLTAGIALRQAGYEVEIYDRVKELCPAVRDFIVVERCKSPQPPGVRGKDGGDRRLDGSDAVSYP